MFVVMKLQDFEMEGVNFPLKVQVITKMAGYLPVYNTRQEAEAEYPGATILEARPCEADK